MVARMTPVRAAPPADAARAAHGTYFDRLYLMYNSIKNVSWSNTSVFLVVGG